MFVIVSRALCVFTGPLLAGLEPEALPAVRDPLDERLAVDLDVLADAGLRDLADDPPLPLRADDGFEEARSVRPRVAGRACAEALSPFEADRPPDRDRLDEPRDVLVAMRTSLSRSAACYPTAA
jgi:hypothetical protein